MPLAPFLARRGIEIDQIFALLLADSARYGGLGAKLHQGWGVFSLLDACDREAALLQFRKLLDLFPRPENRGNQPENSLTFMAEWRLAKNNLGFNWHNQKEPEGDYLATGFALRYRLRRYIKFYETDYRNRDDHPADAEVLPIGADWRAAGRNLRGAVARCPWKESIPFVQVLFGRDNATEDNKFTGLVRVSHQFLREDGNWYVRLGATLPAVCNYRGNGQFRWDQEKVMNFLIRRFSELLEERGCWNKDLTREVIKRGAGQ